MTDTADPYRILGIKRGATVKEIELAYHRAVLRYHPDTRPADPPLAHEKFLQATEAYRTILRSFGRADWASAGPERERTYSPQEFAFAPSDWPFGPKKITSPAVNETAAFVLFWPLAIVLAGAVTFLLANFNLIGDPRRELETLDVVLLSAVGLGVYAAVLAAVVVALVAMRQVVCLVARSVLRRALPPSGDRLLQQPPART